MLWKQFLPALLCSMIGPQDISVNGVPLSIAITPFTGVRNDGSPDDVGAIEGDDGSGYVGAFKEGHSVYKRAAIKDESLLWTNKTIPYDFDWSYTWRDKQLIREAMEEWSRHTCVKFRPASSSDAHQVKFVDTWINPNDGKLSEGCWSYVGVIRLGDMRYQPIGLQNKKKQGGSCRELLTILHEIGHALGMIHTHSRPDRDKYVIVDLSEVPDNLHGQFGKEETWEKVDPYGVEYDYDSVMHYESLQFNGDLAIVTRDREMQEIIGTGEHLSFGDIELMNKLYKCKPKDCRLMDQDCPDTSFVDENCKCACPGPSDENPVVPCNDSDNKGGPEPEAETQPPTQPPTEPPYIMTPSPSTCDADPDYGGDSEWSDYDTESDHGW